MRQHLCTPLLFAAVFAGAVPDGAARASTFSGCGTLRTGFECVLFEADTGEVYLLREFGDFFPGERVRVSGDVDPDCLTFCSVPCLNNETIEACAGVVAISSCGTIVMGVECLLFAADGGGVYVVPGLASAGGPGDRVHVAGELDPRCVSICQQGNGCVLSPQISSCETTFAGCGTLVRGFPCLLFAADGGGEYTLEEYGGFGPGDRVFVEGEIPPTCFTICGEGDGCIFGNTIAPCDAGRPGDMNCDAVVNFDDIEPFVVALISEAAYSAAYPACRWLNGDTDASGAVNFDDIDGFVACLILGACP